MPTFVGMTGTHHQRLYIRAGWYKTPTETQP
jgi:hypothetical protein